MNPEDDAVVPGGVRGWQPSSGVVAECAGSRTQHEIEMGISID